MNDDEIKTALAKLTAHIDARFDELQTGMVTGFGGVGARFDLADQKMDRIDSRIGDAEEAVSLVGEKVASLKKATGDVESAVHETKARLERVGRDMIAARTDDANRYAKLLGRVVVVETRKEGQA